MIFSKTFGSTHTCRKAKIMIVRASDNYCVMCGEIIPEGRQVCPICEKSVLTQSTNDNWQDDIKKYIADYINQGFKNSRDFSREMN